MPRDTCVWQRMPSGTCVWQRMPSDTALRHSLVAEACVQGSQQILLSHRPVALAAAAAAKSAVRQRSACLQKN
jgi:hypothetical protein